MLLASIACSEPMGTVPPGWSEDAGGVPGAASIHISGIVALLDVGADAEPETALSMAGGSQVRLIGATIGLELLAGRRVTLGGSYTDTGLFAVISVEVDQN
jgi:hypothetical protein